jgi:hypothetical protein
MAFGTMVDYAGFAGTDLKLKSSSEMPHPTGFETATDECGNVIAQGDYATGPGTPFTCEYELVSGTLDTGTLFVGAGTLKVIESVEVTTETGAWPKVSVSGITVAAVPASMETFSLPSVTIAGTKCAQLLDFTIESGSRLSNSSIGLSGTIDHTTDGAQGIGAFAFSVDVAKMTAQGVSITGDFGWTLTADKPDATNEWAQEQGPGVEASELGWATAGTLSARAVILADA